MRIERERHVGAQAYERTPERSGYANGDKAKQLDTQAGTLTVQVPKSRGGEAPFYPQALGRGRRSSHAVMLAIAQMYIPRLPGRASPPATP
jgi:transposase-like protein